MLKLFFLWLIITLAFLALVVVEINLAPGQTKNARLFALGLISAVSALLLLLIVRTHRSDKQIEKLIAEANQALADNERRIQLAQAKRVAEVTDPASMAEVLKTLGMTGERELMEARASGMGFPFVDLERIRPDLDAISLVPLDLIKKHRILPVKLAGNQIWVAMQNVNDIKTQDAIREWTGLKVNPCMCLPKALDNAIVKLEET